MSQESLGNRTPAETFLIGCVWQSDLAKATKVQRRPAPVRASSWPSALS